MVTLVKPESSSIFCQPARGSPPAIQAAHRSISRRASGGTGRPLATSANCSAPPGRSTRWISASTVLLSRAEIDRAVRDDDVGPAVFDGQGLGQAFAELDLLQPERVGAGPGLRDHLGCHVDADHMALVTNLPGCDEGIEAGTRADVHDFLAALEMAQREGVAHAGEGLHGAAGKRINDGVAEPLRERAAGAEVETALRVDRDVAVLSANLATQGLVINDLAVHRSLPLSPGAGPPPAPAWDKAASGP